MTRVPLPLLAVLCPGILGQLVLFAGGALAWWLLPLGLALAFALARPWRRPVRGEPGHAVNDRMLVALVAGGAVAIAWGSLATPERSWDGYATWSLTARHLMAGEGLDSAYFADPTVYHYVRGYPLLQPTLVALLGQCLGPTLARLWFPLAWLLLIGGVATAVRAAGPGARVRLAVAGVALVPMFLEPGGGSAESGFADLLVAALAAYAVHGMLANAALPAFAAAALLATTKNEGVLHVALWLGVATLAGRWRAAVGALAGGSLMLAVWLPVQQRLLAPGAAPTIGLATFAPLLLPVLALAVGFALARLPRRARVLLVAAPFLAAMLVPAEILRAASGTAGLPRPQWSALPSALVQVTTQMGWLRRFGATFLVLPMVAAFAWCNRRNAPLAFRNGGSLVAGLAAFVGAITGFLLLVPEATRPLFLREGVGRYLAQVAGVAWIAIGVLAAADDGTAPHAPPERLLRLFAPAGSRRDRALWIAVVTVQKLREGPGPWLRAVKKGIFQLLPPVLQQRILRWTGQDQVFRRGEVRHAGAAAGVDRPNVVSVVLPVYNHADMLAAAIASVLAQDHRDLELIVVDDGSTDGIHAVLQPFLGDPRIRIVTMANQGLPKALSTGFDCATGEFFTWTSADNLMLPGCLARLVAHLRPRPDVAMVYADYTIIDADGEPVVGGEFRFLDRTDKQNPAAVRVKRSTHDLNRYEDNFVGPCFLYRGAIGRLLGDYNPELGLEDYDYWMRVNRLFRLEHLGADDLLYRYRVHDNTLSARARELRIAERAKELMRYERARAAWCEAPLAVLADASALRWLPPLVAAHDTLSPWRAGADPDVDRKTLVVADGATFAGAAPARAPGGTSFAVFFARPADAHAAHLALRELPVAAFAADADTAARLAVHTRAVFAGTPGAEAYALAVRHNANVTFFRTTRDPARLHRAVPMPLSKAAPLRVLLQLDTFGTGGLERVVLDLAHGLAARGAVVGLLALDGSHARAALPDGVEVVELRGHRDDAYRERLRSGRWQIVSAHASTYGAATAAAAGVPFVQTVHNSYVWYDAAAVAACRAADAHTSAYACVSASALAYADLRLHLDVQKMLVLENGIAPAPPPPAPATTAALRAELGLDAEDTVFLMVASVQPAKAHRAAVQALAVLRRTVPRARLVCLGHRMHPLEAAAVDALVHELGLGSAVVFAGHRPDPAPFYAMADAFVLPSYWEGCSLSVFEAIAAGLPLVLSDVGAARHQLRHGRGELVAPPFASTLDLDATALPGLFAALDADYVARLAAAMARVAAAARDSRAAVDLPTSAQRATMAARYDLLFRWLLQGGTVPGVREPIARAATDPPAPRP